MKNKNCCSSSCPPNQYPPEIKTIRKAKASFSGSKKMPPQPSNEHGVRKVKWI